MNCNCNRTTNRMGANTVDSDSRAWIPISPATATNLTELTALLARLHPEDEPTAHYALGYAIQSGLIAARESLARLPESDAQTNASPSPSPVSSPYATLANPRPRHEVARA